MEFIQALATQGTLKLVELLFYLTCSVWVWNLGTVYLKSIFGHRKQWVI